MLIFFDIDGTLIGDRSHVMPESAVRAVATAKRNGHVCAVNTGRTRRLVEVDREKLEGFDAFIMGCGTMVTYREKILYHKTFSPRESREIIDGLRRYRIDALLEGSENIYHDHCDRVYTENFEKIVGFFAKQGFGSFQEAVGNFDKLYSYVEDISKIKAFAAEFEDRLDFVDRQQGFFEIMPKGCSKASAMNLLAEALQIPMSQTAALGDSSNDIPMLRQAQIGIAMGNAAGNVQAAADYVTTALEEDGVWKALDWLGVL